MYDPEFDCPCWNPAVGWCQAHPGGRDGVHNGDDE